MQFDLRSLASLRIALGLLVFCQSILLACDFGAFYQADGVLPPSAWGEPFLRALIFVAVPLFAISLLVGFLTRLATLLCFACLVIIQNANPQILQGGDMLLRLLLFWSLFLPLGLKWSVDVTLRQTSTLVLPLATELATWALTLAN